MAELLLGAEIARESGVLGRVLEIGTGCGYQAAALSRLAARFIPWNGCGDYARPGKSQFAPIATDECSPDAG